MYFWNVEALKKNIADGAFTDKDLIPYLLLYVGFTSVVVELSGYIPYEEINIWTYLSSALCVLIPVAGTIYAYWKNGAGNGNNFASKYFSIGFVVTIRFLVLLIPLTIAMFIYWETRYTGPDEIATSPLEVVLFESWTALLYFRIAKHIGDTTRVAE